METCTGFYIQLLTASFISRFLQNVNVVHKFSVVLVTVSEYQFLLWSVLDHKNGG